MSIRTASRPLLCLTLSLSLLGTVRGRPAFAGNRNVYAADRDEDDIDDDEPDEEAAKKRKKREEARRREEERRREEDRRREEARRREEERRRDEDRRREDERRREEDRRRRDDDRRRDDEDRRRDDRRYDDRRRDDRRDDDRRYDDDRRRDDRRYDDDRRRDDRRRDDRRSDDRRYDDDRRRDDRRDEDRRYDDRRYDDDRRRDGRYDDDRREDEGPRYRRRRGERGPAFRWGVGGGPGVAVANASGDTVVAGGLGLLSARLGYQFPQMGQLALGIYGEPRLGLYFKREGDTTFTTVHLAGSIALQLNIGRYFFLAFGPSVGGQVVTGFGDAARSPAYGGFLFRAGVDLLLATRGERPSALSLAFEVLPLFSHVDNTFVSGTATFCTFGVVVGYESY